MQDYRININYAKALFMLAAELNEQDTVAVDMRLVNAVCADNRELNAVFRNPEIKMSKKAAIVRDLFAEHVSTTTLAFLDFVVHKNRSVNLRGISSSYLDLYRESHNIVLSELVTAEEVDQSITDLVSQTIARHTGKEVELIKTLGFDGKSIINPRQILLCSSTTTSTMPVSATNCVNSVSSSRRTYTRANCEITNTLIICQKLNLLKYRRF